jgi:hypothetical protein
VAAILIVDGRPSGPKAILAKIDAVLSSESTPPMPWLDPSQCSRDQPQVVSSSLESKIQDFEASEQRVAAVVGFAHQIAAEREARALLDTLCAAAREVTLAQKAIMGVEAVDGPAFHRAIADRRPVRLRNPAGRPEAIGLPENHPLTYSSLVVPIASPSVVYGCLGLHLRVLYMSAYADHEIGQPAAHPL